MGMDNTESLIQGAISAATNGGDEGGGDEGHIEGDSAAVETAGGGEESGEQGPVGEEGTSGLDLAAEGETPEVVETPEQVAAREKVEKDDAVLAAIGFRSPKPGKDNRIPYSNVRKILLNGLDKHTAPIRTELDTTKATLAEKEGIINKFDGLIGQPEQLMAWLQSVNPEYKKFSAGQPTATAAAEPAPAADFKESMPAPDRVDKDGNPMYSNEQFEKFMDWQQRKAEHAVEKRLRGEMDKRLTPFEREAKARAAYQERAARIKSEVDDVKAQWGDLLPKDGTKEAGEVIALMQKNPGWTLARAASAYILPRLRQSRNDQRADILKELNKAPARASKGQGGAGTRTQVESTEPKGTEDVIRQAMREAGLTQN